MNNLFRALFATALLFSANAFAQSAGAAAAQPTSGQNGSEVAAVAEEKPKAAEPIVVMRDYHGVRLGMPQDDVHKAMGKPDRRDKTWDEFKLEKDDLMTVRYQDGKVHVIQLYFTDAGRAPEFAEVVGVMELTQKDNGAKFARRVVADENFWISMYQSGDKKVTTITIGR